MRIREASTPDAFAVTADEVDAKASVGKSNEN
jgi:hypothetical protein